LHLQLIRFHSHQYSAVTQQIYPKFETLDTQSISYLHYIKAYSATLSRNPVIAGDNFKACDIHKDMAIVDEFNLYQLNIFALYNVIINNIDVAYDLEMKIESYIQDHDIKTVGLKYVNYINIARLFKKLEKYDVSLAYYQNAYDELSGGGYTASDYIYYNMNLGSLFEAWGETQKASTCWIKSALHWLVSENPYALAWRPKIILCGEKTSDLNQVLSLEKVTRFFIHKIESLIKLDAVEESHSQPLEFVLNKSKISNAEAYVLDDLIVYSSLNRAIRAFGPRQQLQSFMSRVIRSLFHIDKNANTISIDYLSDDVIRKTKNFWPLSMIHNCEKWNINNENVSQAEIDHLKSTVELSVSLSALIHTVSEQDGTLNLNYHRSFMDKQLVNQAEIALVIELQSCKSFPVSKLPGNIDVINLLYKNVLELKFEDKDF
jgi:tetratricopeptide (TPR) repeat protein